MLVKKTSKNQLTLPKEIADLYHDTVYFEVTRKEGRIILEPVRIIPAHCTLESIREKIKKLGITPEDVTHAVKWARKRKD